VVSQYLVLVECELKSGSDFLRKRLETATRNLAAGAPGIKGAGGLNLFARCSACGTL